MVKNGGTGGFYCKKDLYINKKFTKNAIGSLGGFGSRSGKKTFFCSEPFFFQLLQPHAGAATGGHGCGAPAMELGGSGQGARRGRGRPGRSGQGRAAAEASAARGRAHGRTGAWAV